MKSTGRVSSKLRLRDRRSRWRHCQRARALKLKPSRSRMAKAPAEQLPIHQAKADMTIADFQGQRLFLGCARFSRVGDSVSPLRTLSEDCFGETPKPTRE